MLTLPTVELCATCHFDSIRIALVLYKNSMLHVVSLLNTFCSPQVVILTVVVIAISQLPSPSTAKVINTLYFVILLLLLLLL